MNYSRALSLLLILLPIATWAASPFSATHGDTTIGGRTYSLVPATDLISHLHTTPSGTLLQTSDVLFTGPFLAGLTALDTVRAHLDFQEIIFAEEVNLDRVVFLGDISFDRSQFQGGLSLLDATFHGDLHLTSASIARHISCKRAAFHGSVDLSETRFDGSASFIEATFTGDYQSFARTHFEDSAYFERTHFAGDVDFRDAAFQRQISCKEARWEGALSFAGTRFYQRARFWQAHFGGNVDFDASLTVGELGFENATFSRPASFRRAVFVRLARFVETDFDDQVTFAGSRFQRGAEFYATRFAAGVVFRSLFAGDLDLRQVETPFLDLRPPIGDPQYGLADTSFATGAQVLLQEAHYGQLLLHWPHLAGCLAAADSSSLEDLAPVYAGLRRQLEDRGLHAEADACRSEWWERYADSLPWVSPERCALQFFGLSTRYGTSLQRLGLFTLICALLFTLLFRLLRPVAGDQPLSLIDCAYLSFSTFLGRPSHHPTGGIRILILVEGLLAWVCWGLFIATTLFLLMR